MSEIGVENLTKGVHHIHTSGGRTRSVVNLAAPGSEGTVAYTFKAASAVPTLAQGTNVEAGYKNFGLNRNLHILAMNYNTTENCTLKIWAYHSFAQKWAILQGVDPTDGSHHDITLIIATDSDDYFIIPIEGIERIAIQCSNYHSGVGDADQYVEVY